MKDITIDCSAQSLGWSIKVSNLRVAVYDAKLFDKDNKMIGNWERQRTDDSIADNFPFPPGVNLDQSHLWFYAIVQDPADTGGPYVGEVAILDDGSVVDKYSHTGSIPAGDGMMDSFSDEIRLLCKS